MEIPKKDGKVRKLGIPTIADRVAQMVVKDYLEERFEKIFSPNPYGYRPDKSAHQALEKVRQNCRKTDWVIDLDIKGFFDNTELKPLFLLLRQRLVWWARKRYKRYQTNMIKAYRWLDRVQKQFPNLFYQWRYGFA